MHNEFGRRAVLGLSAAGVVGAALGSYAAPALAQPPEPPDRVMIIRHAEDPYQPGQPVGVTSDGMEDSKRSLIVRGWTRAGALVSLFDPRDHEGNRLPTRPHLARPTAIFAHNPGAEDSKRSWETVSPIAAALNLDVDIRYTQRQVAELAATVSAMRGSTLIAWRHEQIAEIISHFGRVEPAPPVTWPKHRYDMVYVLTRNHGGWSFLQVPQMLLAGDQSARFA